MYKFKKGHFDTGSVIEVEGSSKVSNSDDSPHFSSSCAVAW